MRKSELLKKYYEMEMNKVFAYSANYLMNSPKKGYEKEWKEAMERAELLEEMMQAVKD